MGWHKRPRMPVAVWHTAIPLFAAAFLVYGYNNVFMTLLPSFVQEGVGGNPLQAGLQGTVFLVTAIGLRFYFGPLADRIGTKPVMALGVGAFVLGALLLTACTAFWQVLCIRCVQAVGLAAFYPCATAAVADAAPPGRSGFLLGLFRLVTSASLLLGPTVAFALAEAQGYRPCFATMGACALAALLLVTILPSAQKPAKAEPAPARTTPGAGLAAKHPNASSTLRRALEADPHCLALVLGSTFVAAVGYGLLFTFAATFVASVDPTANAGAYFALIGMGGLVANPVVGCLADRMGHTRLLATCLACTAVGIALLGVYGASGPGPFGTAVFAASGLSAGVGYAGTMTCALTIVATSIDAQVRSSVLALQQNAIDLGIACAGVVFGAAITAAGGAMAWVFVAQGALMLACTAAGTVALRGCRQDRDGAGNHPA